jgi:hypothetical protein
MSQRAGEAKQTETTSHQNTQNTLILKWYEMNENRIGRYLVLVYAVKKNWAQREKGHKQTKSHFSNWTKNTSLNNVKFRTNGNIEPKRLRFGGWMPNSRCCIEDANSEANAGGSGHDRISFKESHDSPSCY